MPLLPNYKNAVISDQKIYDYCLNTNHERGQHKAKVFRQVFGISREDGEVLKLAILAQLDKFEVVSEIENKYGKLFTLPMKITIFGKTEEIITVWITENKFDYPRLVSCYVNK